MQDRCMEYIKSEGPHPKARPSYIGRPSGARVAPQRCPILRKDGGFLRLGAVYVFDPSASFFPYLSFWSRLFPIQPALMKVY